MGNKNMERPVNTFDHTDFQKKLKFAREEDWEESPNIEWFKDNGWDVCYSKGLVDKTPYYTRVEEDCIVIKNHRYIIQVNIPSCTTVLQLLNDNSDCYGGKPTMFLTKVELYHLSALIDDIDVVVNHSDFAS